MIEPGAEFRDYEVWGKIGGGGMSDVWLARHRLLSIPLIVKTLKPEIGIPPEEHYERMLNEARLMARVHSDRVVRAVDVGMHAEMPYLVQEYVDGLDLAEVDARRRRALGVGLPLWFVCDAIAQIADGLHAAHNAGVLHRDIKPSNLFGSPESGLKLGDFGIARSKGKLDSTEISGTIAFMAPEALRGEATDRRTDVYGLGATAFDLRYGFHPYDDLNVLLHGRPRPGFPPPAGPEEAYFQHVVTRMIAVDPAERYASLTEPKRLLSKLAQSLRRALPVTQDADGTLHVGRTRVVCESGDIARAQADGIVCSSVPEMRLLSGVGLALIRVGGRSIEEEALLAGDQPLGNCVVTGAGELRARKVLHAVSAWREASCVGRAMQRALLSAEEHQLHSLAVPALGTGVARVTLESAAAAEGAALRFHLSLAGSRLSEVRFVLLDDTKLRAFREVLEEVLLGDAEDQKSETGVLHQEGAHVSTVGPTFVSPSLPSSR
jgi:eukaryotic-like serine/threonine-protein kinase